MLAPESLGLAARLSVAALLILTYPLARAIHNVYFHPLAHCPGPRRWAASRLPFVWSLLSGMIVHDVDKLHRKYGPVVRVAPNEISFAHMDAWSDIFQGRPGHLPFLKDPVWWAKVPEHPESLITAINPEIHARIRKVLSGGFTQRALRAQEPIVQKYVGLLIERLRGLVVVDDSGSAVLDIVPWFNYTTFDIFGDLGFAESFDCLQDARYHPWIALLFNSVKAFSFGVAARFYPLIEFILMKCIPKSLKKMQSDHFQQIVGKVQRRLNWEVERSDLMSHVIKHNNEKEEMSHGEIQATFMVLTTAGSETTATVLSGTLNNLISKPQMLSTLTKEIRGEFAKEADMTLDALCELPYLNATIQEGLRLCPPIPVILPRVVPEGGDFVCGMWLPAGTSVSLQTWSLFRDPQNFHEAANFLPERWLPSAEQPESPFYNDQRDAVQPFSVGSRSCMGKHLAWAEMRLVLARMLWEFDVNMAGKPLKWEDLKTFLLVEKRPIDIRIQLRKDLK
ncbi:Versicolorin B desaturase [Lachnellula suecica]|uniref:Versicolorin B desaturase n=1 Tax=Lachnellula suecica TaxID=602035 RepID=A0A8T9CGY2_9HELO|nr:Versicolorin B desaturase [Lachnellula suecica]